MKALLISDDAPTKQFLIEALQEYGHEVILAEDASAAWRLVRRDVDVVLFDLEKATDSHWERLAAWRRATDLPFITLGPWDNQDSAVRALQIGADDYIPRPLHVVELIARMEARLRRARMPAQVQQIEEQATPNKRVILDWQALQVKVGDRRVDLTPTEFKVLESLLRSKGQPVSREELIQQVWGTEKRGTVTNLNLYIWHLRQKLEEDPAHPKLIVTRWGLGYSLQQDNT